MRYRNGFTAAELLMVISIVGIVSAFGLPRLDTMRDQSARQSAKGHIATSIATARAAAIQQGRPARFNAVGNTIWVTVQDGAGNHSTISGPIQLDSLYRMSLEASTTTITFDSRGLARGLPVDGAFYELVRGEKSEWVCVTRMGMVRVEGCE